MSATVVTAARVTVVMPSFNQGRFIEAAVRSVLEQAYPGLELLIVDGGSSDGTLPCLERLLAVFGDKLRWLSEKDSGPANAINKALRLARGEFVGWLNSDDLYAPGAVATAAAYLTANPEMVMVYGEAEHVDETGTRLAAYQSRRPPFRQKRSRRVVSSANPAFSCDEKCSTRSACLTRAWQQPLISSYGCACSRLFPGGSVLSTNCRRVRGCTPIASPTASGDWSPWKTSRSSASTSIMPNPTGCLPTSRNCMRATPTVATRRPCRRGLRPP
ncbi:MAG: glycosyltransferase [Candidatus Accumulibacter sp.]|nr:glycosyltransferase [Accumulibacter sp.]